MAVDAPKLLATLASLPPAEAVKYMQARGLLTETFSHLDLFQAEHATQFTVSRLARTDLLQAVYDGVSASVKGDMGRRDFVRGIKDILVAEGWWGEKQVPDPKTGELLTTRFDSARLKLIYDTNTRMAYSAGLWQRIERNRSTSPYIRYITKRDERVRASHRAWNNLTLPVDHPFWDTHFPPNGWRCRCRAMSMSQAEYDKGVSPTGEKLNKQAPEIELVEWKNKRTGKVEMVPRGVDPAFAYNPGKAAQRAENLAQLAGDKLAGYPLTLGSAAYTDLRGPILSAAKGKYEALVDRLYDHAATEPLKLTGERFILSALDAELLAAMRQRSLPLPGSAPIIATDRDLAHLARADKAGRSQALPPETVKRLPELLDRKSAVLWDTEDPALIYVIDVPDGAGKIVVRTGYEDQIKADGKKIAVKENRLRTGGVVEIETLKQQRYLLLTGEL